MGTFAMLVTGAFYAWSVFVPALQQEFGWNASQTSLVFTLTVLFFNVGSFVAGRLVGRIGVRATLMAGSALMFAGVSGSSLANSHAFMLMSFGAVCGTGVGFVYNMLLSTVAKWYPDKSGFCSGALLLGFGMSGMVFGTLVGQLVKSIGWRTTFLVMGIPIGLVALMASLFVRLPNEDELAELPQPERKGGAVQVRSFTTAQMLRSSQFWIFAVRVLLMVGIGLAVVGNATPMATELGASAELAVFLASVISLANGCGRILFGWVFDRIGKRGTLILDAAVYLGALVLLMFAGFTHAVPLMAVAFVVLGLAYGGIASCNAAYILGTFGPDDYASNFGAFNIASMLSSPISQLVGGTLAVALGSYAATFPVLVAIAGVGLLLSLLLKDEVDLT